LLRPSFQAAQDLRIGGRSSNALYQYTIQSDNVQDLAHWGPILLAGMKKLPGFQDVNSDAQNSGLQELLTYDRPTAARLGITPSSLDSPSPAPSGSRKSPSSTRS
jgi:multidrug efflux pump